MIGGAVSLAMIVRDSSKTLEKCLSSIRPAVDEIIVVDTGSVDNTMEIARKYADKVFTFKWIDDFAAARNFAFSKIKTPYGFWVDSDDYMLPEDVAKMKALDLTNIDTVIGQYHYAHDEFGKVMCIVPRERIVRMSLNPTWHEEIHEYLDILGRQYISDFAIQHNKQHGTSDRNLKILERIVKRDPSKHRNVFYLGKEYYDSGKSDEALVWLEKFVNMPGSWWEDVYRAYMDIGLIYLNKGNEEKFKENILKSINLEDRRAEPYYQLAFYYQCRNQWDKAIQWYEMCLNVRRPAGLLASYQPEYYTWLPALQLCVCYNAIGDMKKAYEYNKKVLEYRPKDTRAINNDLILKGALSKKNTAGRKDGEGKRLHLGCGNRRMEGYVNADIFKGDAVDEVFSMGDIPYADGTISEIYNEHVLEHLPFEKAEAAIREWCRVLKPGGVVNLYMPDMELCFKKYLEAPLEAPNFMTTKAWFKATVYGIQKSQAGEPDEAQIHQCGFSKDEIRIVMGRNGFMVDTVENYGGPGQKPDYCTPSMYVRAIKPASNLKVAWIGAPNYEAAQTRIRVHAVDDWLRSNGYRSKIVDYPDVLRDNYDIAIVGKGFDENHYRNIRWLKREGKTVFCDLCEDLIDWPYVNEILAVCDKVICCSHALEERVKTINPNTMVIEDAWE